MKTGQPSLITSIRSAVSVDPYYFIGFDGNKCAANAKALGVSEASADANEQLPVVVEGIAVILSGAAVSVGEPVVSDANAKAVPAANLSVTIPAGATPVTSDAAQPNLLEAGSVLPQAINGYALDAATGANEFIRIKLI